MQLQKRKIEMEDIADMTNDTAELSPLDRARKKKAEQRAMGIPEVRLDPVQRSTATPKSLRLAVTAKCWACVGGDADPHPRQRIRDCTVMLCPLRSVRPYQNCK